MVGLRKGHAIRFDGAVYGWWRRRLLYDGFGVVQVTVAVKLDTVGDVTSVFHGNVFVGQVGVATHVVVFVLLFKDGSGFVPQNGADGGRRLFDLFHNAGVFDDGESFVLVVVHHGRDDGVGGDLVDVVDEDAAARFDGGTGGVLAQYAFDGLGELVAGLLSLSERFQQVIAPRCGVGLRLALGRIMAHDDVSIEVSSQTEALSALQVGAVELCFDVFEASLFDKFLSLGSFRVIDLFVSQRNSGSRRSAVDLLYMPLESDLFVKEVVADFTLEEHLLLRVVNDGVFVDFFQPVLPLDVVVQPNEAEEDVFAIHATVEDLVRVRGHVVLHEMLLCFVTFAESVTASRALIVTAFLVVVLVEYFVWRVLVGDVVARLLGPEQHRAAFQAGVGDVEHVDVLLQRHLQPERPGTL